LVLPSFAYSIGSENFNSTLPTISGGGYEVSSSNYISYPVIGTIAGVTSSTNYRNYLGFWFGGILAEAITEYWDVTLIGGILSVGVLFMISGRTFEKSKHWILRRFLLFAGVFIILIGINISIVIAGLNNPDAETLTTLLYKIWTWLIIVFVAFTFIYLLLKGLFLIQNQKWRKLGYDERHLSFR